MKINAIEFELNLLDADVADRVEAASVALADEFNTRIAELKQMSAGKSIREQCNLINAFFDSSFGVGASKRIFENRVDLSEHLDTYAQFIDSYQSEREFRYIEVAEHLAEKITAAKSTNEK